MLTTFEQLCVKIDKKIAEFYDSKQRVINEDYDNFCVEFDEASNINEFMIKEIVSQYLLNGWDVIHDFHLLNFTHRETNVYNNMKDMRTKIVNMMDEMIHLSRPGCLSSIPDVNLIVK